ncbi:MAG TPA: nicotinate phosphoribosyltransferase, partial [Terriglobia bacterium]|nr:nicotinate phosphoribosyltransferase [Terriglobia bacterium]
PLSTLPMDQPFSNRALLVDLYELTMAAGYFEHGMDFRATFELFVRSLPSERSYLVAAGVDDALDYLENLRFTDDDIRYLRSLPPFRTVPGKLFDYLRNFRFKGDVAGMPEGTVVFAEEPILQVTAPIAEAQIVETYLLSVVNFETLVASKAARVVRAAQGRTVLEFGTRRAQGPEAGLRAARAAYLGGCDATSNTKAGRLYGIPVAGTAAHSWTQAFPTERESFEALLDLFPETGVLLIDTYDDFAGAETAASLGRKFSAVRLDSGDLLEKSRKVRTILDARGLQDVKIIASGDLNEYRIEELVGAGAPIDSFGVGTDLATSRDVPALSVVYKLVETERGGQVEYKAKFSEEKVYYPGRKQVFRFTEDGQYHHDLLARSEEESADGGPLLQPLMRNGRRVGARRTSSSIRDAALANIDRLPERYHALRGAPEYPVKKSDALLQLLEQIRSQYVSAQKPAGAPHAR